MSINDLAREQTTHQRQHDEQRQEAALSRAEEELTADAQPDELREQATDHRLHDEHLHENVLSRAEEQVDR